MTAEQLFWLRGARSARMCPVRKRGFIRPGYNADRTIVKRDTPWTLTEYMIQSKCGWSPLTGDEFHWRVMKTICNGHTVFDNGRMDESYRGEAVTFAR